MLDSFDAGLRALRNMTHTTLIDIPSLTKLVLRVAFRVVQKVDMRNASLLEEYDSLAKVQEKTIVKDLVIRDRQGLEALTYYVEKVTVVDECCNESGITAIDFTPCERLRELRVGDECFKNVNELKLVGLNALESVVIGENSFSKQDCFASEDPSRRFYLKNCPALKELKMGCGSFSDYSVCEIESVDALEVMEMGDLDMTHKCCNFYWSSLVLKSVFRRIDSGIDLPSLKSLVFGSLAFRKCSHVIFESDFFVFALGIDLPELESIQMGYNAFWFRIDSDNTTLELRSTTVVTN